PSSGSRRTTQVLPTSCGACSDGRTGAASRRVPIRAYFRTSTRACARHGVLDFEQKCLRTYVEFVSMTTVVRCPRTGRACREVTCAGKRLELLRELVPGLRRLAIMGKPRHHDRAREPCRRRPSC